MLNPEPLTSRLSIFHLLLVPLSIVDTEGFYPRDFDVAWLRIMDNVEPDTLVAIRETHIGVFWHVVVDSFVETGGAIHTTRKKNEGFLGHDLSCSNLSQSDSDALPC